MVRLWSLPAHRVVLDVARASTKALGRRPHARVRASHKGDCRRRLHRREQAAVPGLGQRRGPLCATAFCMQTTTRRVEPQRRPRDRTVLSLAEDLARVVGIIAGNDWSAQTPDGGIRE